MKRYQWIVTTKNYRIIPFNQFITQMHSYLAHKASLKKAVVVKESTKNGERSFICQLSHFVQHLMFNRVYAGIKQHLTKLHTESDQTNPNNSLPPTPTTTQSCPPNLIENQEEVVSQPITFSPGRGEPVRRRSSLFGISGNQHDDFVQKDLMSSSWS